MRPKIHSYYTTEVGDNKQSVYNHRQYSKAQDIYIDHLENELASKKESNPIRYVTKTPLNVFRDFSLPTHFHFMRVNKDGTVFRKDNPIYYSYKEVLNSISINYEFINTIKE